MSKMFVHYSGTVEAFKSIASQYDNKIVFIKGGENGEGAAIYTHGKYYGDVKDALAALQQTVGGLKYFTSIKAGDKTASATGKDGIITFNATDPAQVSVDVDANGVNIGLATKFTDAVAANTSGLANEISRATDAEGKIRADLGQKNDEADADGSAFARIAQLADEIEAMTGSNGSIADQIDAAIKLLNADMVGGGANEYIASIKEESGKIVATKGTFNFDEAGAAATVKSEVIGAIGDASTVNTIYGAKKYAEEKADDTATAKANQALTDAKAYVGEEIAKLNADVTSAETGKVKVQVVEVAGKITEVHVTESDIASAEVLAAVKSDVDYFLGSALNKDNAEAVKDTLKEIQDYIDSDVKGAAGMTASIKEAKDAANAAQVAANNAQDDVNTLESVVAGVKTTIEAAATKDALQAEINRADTAEKLNAAAIKAIADDYLVGQDRTDLEGMINGKVTQSVYDQDKAALQKADSDNLTAAKEHADGLVNALNVTDAAVANQFVTAVSESAGKISVSRSAINASQIGITNTENDAFAADTQNVQAALNELAGFWAWEEL